MLNFPQSIFKTHFQAEETNCMKRTNKKSGFTLVEMLVVIAIIGLLVAILLPALSAARESGRSTQCKSNLRQFYVSFMTHADRDQNGRFGSGNYDFTRDGCPDTWGWVADMVNQGVGRPIEMMCPSSPYRGSEKYNDLLGKSTGVATEGCPIDRLSDGACGVGGGFGGTAITTPERAKYIGEQFLAKGYGTNYMTSWFFGRGGPRLLDTGSTPKDLVFPAASDAIGGKSIKGLAGTTGPLSRNVVDSGAVPSNLIPLAGDSNVGDSQDSVLDLNIPRPVEEGGFYMQAGGRLCETSSDGPIIADGDLASLTIETVTTTVGWSKSSSDIMVQKGDGSVSLFENEQPPAGQPAVFQHLQDWRDFGPVHGSGKGGQCNVLFADGSVKAFLDANGDGFLNPGIPLDPATVDASKTGYTDSTVELPRAQVFSGVFIEKSPAKGVLD
jgi:prepilin-type N-terminal cleavage/methylation domain-containing protein/prepilin-type processing-associated H-X9-DG protein